MQPILFDSVAEVTMHGVPGASPHSALWDIRIQMFVLHRGHKISSRSYRSSQGTL